jgi:cellulose synthase/poly-beta-1,6-N-acetylglucosamine synthase-like glycosyltransferase
MSKVTPEKCTQADNPATTPAELSVPFAEELTILIPSYNEAKNIPETIRSLRAQTTPPKEIIVVDDGSSDDTSGVARSLGVRVLRPAKNTGSKAAAQNFALPFVTTAYTMTIDADTTLAPDAIEKLGPAFEDPTVVTACGFVIPRYISTIWERGRYLEYLASLTLMKPVQNYYASTVVSSGCFSAYRTDILKSVGGWSMRTVAEDMDLTWTFYMQGYRTRFMADAVCYPIEPNNFSLLRKQMTRWTHGFVQNVMMHWRKVAYIRYLNILVTFAVWDSIFVSLAYLIVLPAAMIYFQTPLFALGYFIDAPVMLFPALVAAWRRGEVGKFYMSIPSYFIMRFVNSLFVLEAFWTEMIVRRRLTEFVKGHD